MRELGDFEEEGLEFRGYDISGGMGCHVHSLASAPNLAGTEVV